MKPLAGIRWASSCSLVCGAVLVWSGGVLTYQRLPAAWPTAAMPVRMALQAGSWNGAARDAASAWNDAAKDAGSGFRFGFAAPPGPPSVSCSEADDRNTVALTATHCGDAWDPATLAVTRWWVDGEDMVDADVLFNGNHDWALYDGPWRGDASPDFRRVAVHEFGHVLGLDHPDEHGQFKAAIMNSRAGNVYTLQADDVAGLVAVYGGMDPGTRCTLEDLGTVSGTVVRDGTLGHDCVSPNYVGELARYYSFRLVQATDVRIDMSSSAFDAWLTLRRGADVRGEQVDADDDGGGERNARISRRLEAGEYTIEATSYLAGETGAFRLTLTVAGGGSGPAGPSAPAPTTPPTLDLTCHGYDEGATRAYNCIPEPAGQPHMRTFVPPVGSVCDGGVIAEFPPGRIVFQIRCRDDGPGQSAAWSHSGRGRTSFVKPADTPRVRLRTAFSGSSAHLSVWCRAPQEHLVVNELLGAAWGNDGTDGIYGMAGCREVEVDTGAEDLQWRFTQEAGAPALTPPRSWERVTGAGSALGAEALRDLAAAAELERRWRER